MSRYLTIFIERDNLTITILNRHSHYFSEEPHEEFIDSTFILKSEDQLQSF